MACPANAPPTSTATATAMRDTEPDTPKKLMIFGIKRTVRYNPAPRPTQENTRAKKPSRQPPSMASATTTRMPMSRAFMGPGRSRG